MYSIEYNNKTSTELGIAVTTRPSIPAPKPRGDFIEVAGRNGALFQSDGTYEDIQIDIALNYVRSPQYFADTFRRVKSWLSGSGRLVLSDDPNWFYKVKQAFISSTERQAIMGNVFVASFICDPFTYVDSGQHPLSVDEVILNPYHECQPIYYITGSGNFTLTVNGNALTGDIEGKCIIDTELLLAHDGEGNNLGNSVSGDYDKLHILPGENSIDITQGFTLEVQPNWRSL